MAGNLNNEHGNPAGLRLSIGGGPSVTAVNLPGTVTQANWLFFDINLNGNTSGTFSIEAPRRAATQGASLGGVTFDLLDSGTVVEPVISATISGGSLSLTWEGGGSYNVMTNDNLLDAGGWGVATNGPSPIELDIGSDPELFYKLEGE